MGGWVAGSIKNKAISASKEVEVEVEAELGNNMPKLELHLRKYIPACRSVLLYVIFGGRLVGVKLNMMVFTK